MHVVVLPRLLVVAVIFRMAELCAHGRGIGGEPGRRRGGGGDGGDFNPLFIFLQSFKNIGATLLTKLTPDAIL